MPIALPRRSDVSIFRLGGRSTARLMTASRSTGMSSRRRKIAFSTAAGLCPMRNRLVSTCVLSERSRLGRIADRSAPQKHEGDDAVAASAEMAPEDTDLSRYYHRC